MKYLNVVLLTLAISSTACSQAFQPSKSPENTNTPPPTSTAIPTLTRSTLVSGLDKPWDIAFSEDGKLFFTEKCRGLSVRKTDGTVNRIFGITGFGTVAGDVYCQGQSGVHGLALHPEFDSNRTVFLFMSSNLASPISNRALRLVLNSDFTATESRTDIITDIPFKNDSNNWGSPGAHSGGRLKFGPDKRLYVTTGDNHNGPLPQSTSLLGGKVLRVNTDGQGFADNNSPGDTRIFTLGHRNVQGIAFHPSTGQAIVSEHGPNHSDEVTFLLAGGNGGWDPTPQTGVNCDDGYCGYISNRTDGKLTSMTDKERIPTALPAAWNNNGESSGTGPCAFLTGPQWKAWDGALAVGVMGAGRMDILRFNADKSLKDSASAPLPSDRMRAITQGPDGFLYVATDSGNIWQVKPN